MFGQEPVIVAMRRWSLNGASRYALSKGDKAEAEKLWPLIEWCLEYLSAAI